MAKHNYVALYALVRQPPIIEETGFGMMAMCPVTVIRGNRDSNSTKIIYQAKYSTPIIMSEEDRIIDEVSTWNENDIVYIIGFIATRDVEKKAICPSCGAENSRRDACTGARSGGNRIYVYPIFAERMKSFPEQGIAHSHLIHHAEISNRVFLLGNLTREPVQGSSDDGKYYTRFQIAVDRKYCVQGLEEIQEKTDYPWIYSYGEKARINYAVLHTGSKVYIDGALQTRRYKEIYHCQYCGEEFPVTGRTLEVLAYDTEFLSNYDEITPEENNLINPNDSG